MTNSAKNGKIIPNNQIGSVAFEKKNSFDDSRGSCGLLPFGLLEWRCYRKFYGKFEFLGNRKCWFYGEFRFFSNREHKFLEFDGKFEFFGKLIDFNRKLIDFNRKLIGFSLGKSLGFGADIRS